MLDWEWRVEAASGDVVACCFLYSSLPVGMSDSGVCIDQGKINIRPWVRWFPGVKGRI